MDDRALPVRRRAVCAAAPLLALALALVPAAPPAGAGESRATVPYEARAGLALASEAAWAWAHDAVLVYIENDEDVGAAGSAGRWGYLFHSAALDRSRAYSIRDGRILVAENLAMAFAAPPLPAEWIDSGRALAAAEAGGGARFRREHGAEVRTMLLMRGAFQEGDPDETSWTVVYGAPAAPPLFVVVDAGSGRVRRTWRG